MILIIHVENQGDGCKSKLQRRFANGVLDGRDMFLSLDGRDLDSREKPVSG